MWREVGRIALAVIALAIVVLAANYGYGLIHEAAHGAMVNLAGGEVFEIYVNPLGLDAYTEYSPATGTGLVAIDLAGLLATTLVAALLTIAGKEVVPAIFALRTAIYAINYAPGTDIANLYGTVGNAALAISIVIITINVAAIAFALRHRLATPKDLFSSLSRGRSLHNSGE